MKYKAVLIDVDDTLFDFRASSYAALVKTFAKLGVDFTDQHMRHYEAYNNRLWQQFERGEIEKDFIFPERFRLYLGDLGLNADPLEINKSYLQGLAEGYAFKPHCEELLRALHGKYKVFVVTNGDTYAQEARIARSGMAKYFDAVFISEQMGCNKPDREFFDVVFRQVGEEYRSCSLIVGDSLTSDMQGGRNAGIPTCLYGRPERADERCDYAISDLLELLPILEGEEGK